MVGDAPLWKVICTNLGRAVAGRNKRFSPRSNVVDILLMLFVVDERPEACQCALFVLRLVASFGTFNQNFFGNAGVRILLHIA